MRDANDRCIFSDSQRRSKGFIFGQGNFFLHPLYLSTLWRIRADTINRTAPGEGSRRSAQRWKVGPGANRLHLKYRGKEAEARSPLCDAVILFLGPLDIEPPSVSRGAELFHGFRRAPVWDRRPHGPARFPNNARWKSYECYTSTTNQAHATKYAVRTTLGNLCRGIVQRYMAAFFPYFPLNPSSILLARFRYVFFIQSLSNLPPWKDD